MAKVIIFMEGGNITHAVSDEKDVQVFKIEMDDAGDAARGDEYRLLNFPGKDGGVQPRWAYEIGDSIVNKRFVSSVVPQILSDETLATWCVECEKKVYLKDTRDVDGKRTCTGCLKIRYDL